MASLGPWMSMGITEVTEVVDVDTGVNTINMWLIDVLKEKKGDIIEVIEVVLTS